MPTLHYLNFEGHDLCVAHRPDGLVLLDGTALARLLGYDDELGALHSHCRVEGFIFCSQPRPTSWSDIHNTYCLVIRSESSVAKRLGHWISHWLLPRFSDQRSQPHVRKAVIGEQPLRVLNWRDECWISLHGAIRLLRIADQNVVKALADLRSFR